MFEKLVQFIDLALGRSVPPPRLSLQFVRVKRRGQCGHHKHEEGVVLLGSVFLMIFLSLMYAAVTLRADMQLKDMQTKTDAHRAFYAAETALDQAIFELRRDLNWRPTDSDGDGVSDEVTLTVDVDGTPQTIGFYTLQFGPGVFVQDNFDNIMVLAKGIDPMREVTKAVMVRIRIANPARFLFSSLGDLRFAGGSSIDFDVLGQDVYFDLLPDGSESIDVNGDVFYLRDVIGESIPGVNFGIDPDTGNPYEPTAADSITFPGVDVAYYQDEAQQREDLGTGLGCVLDGDQNIDLDNLDTVCGGPSGVIPEIVFVDGDATVSGEYEGNVTIVSTENIFIDGDVEAFNGEPFQIGLLADQDVIIPASVTGDLTIEAFVMADGEGDANGVFEAVGNKTGELTFKGAISARGENVPTAINLNAFLGGRNYEFNSELANNSLLPLIPAIADIVEWEDRNPNRVMPADPLTYDFNNPANIL